MHTKIGDFVMFFLCKETIFLAKLSIFGHSMSHIFWKLLIWRFIWYIWGPSMCIVHPVTRQFFCLWDGNGSISWNHVGGYLTRCALVAASMALICQSSITQDMYKDKKTEKREEEWWKWLYTRCPKKVAKQNFGGNVGRLDEKTREPPEANYTCPLGHGHSWH